MRFHRHGYALHHLAMYVETVLSYYVNVSAKRYVRLVTVFLKRWFIRWFTPIISLSW